MSVVPIPIWPVVLMSALIGGAAILGMANVAWGDALPAGIRMAGFVASGLLGGLAVPVLRGALPSAIAGYGAALVLVATVGLASTSVNGLLPTLLAFLGLASGTASLAALALALHRIWTTGEPVRLESDWGGLGHGVGGWQLSAPAALLLCAFAFGGMTVGAVALYAGRVAASGEPRDAAAKPGAAPAPIPVAAPAPPASQAK